MSELKWNWVYYPYLDAPNKQEESALKAGYIKVVIKEEADKVIAEKDKQIEELKHQRDGAFGLANLGLTLEDLTKLARKEIDRQKCKRCLAMAKWCDAQVEWYNSLNEEYSFWLELYVKWHKRWLELAEKFKEMEK